MPSSKPTAGVNDLASQFPDVAKEAFGWDPRLVRYGSKKDLQWKCSEGHTWIAKPNSRTGNEKTRGCPYCTNRKAWTGFNDLQTRYPEIAQEANGWDPTLVTFGTTENKLWKCKLGHEYKMPVVRRTHGENTQGCPYCANQKVLAGFNDLASKYPVIAQEASGWDPAKELSKSGKKMSWRCKIGHKYKMKIGARTIQNQGCPYCSNMKVLKGFNDLQTTHPAIALQADDWLPDSIVAGTNKKKTWICNLGHQWTATPDERTRGGTGCPYCCNKLILPGFNDLKTHYPEIAAQAFGWDPSKFAPRSSKRFKWECSEGHTWFSTIADRVGTDYREGRGCPKCAEYGYNPSKAGYFYLMCKPGEQQFGITNSPGSRMSFHQSRGWQLIEMTPARDGQKVLDTETLLKRWLKKNCSPVPGHTENWFTSELEVQSLAELKRCTGIETDIF